jgi:predicted small secreted protein
MSRKLTKLFAASIVALGLLSTGCGTMRRLGKDAFITVTSPLLVPFYYAPTDAYVETQSLFDNYKQDDREGLMRPANYSIWLPTPSTTLGDGLNPPQLVLSFLSYPFAYVGNLIKHTYYVARHVVDIPLCVLFYWEAELHPYGPEVEPLDIYQGTWFDKESDGANKASDSTGSK